MIRRILKRFIKGYLRDMMWNIYGRSFEKPLLPAKPLSLLFICKGNMCRSPFAERIARKLSKENALGEFVSKSAGLKVLVPEESPKEAIAAARTFDIDLSAHISHALDLHDASESDLIVAMEASHVKYLKKLYPEMRNKIFLLPLFEKDNLREKGYFGYNIPDPYGQDVDRFQACYKRITLAVDEMLRTIYSVAGGKE